MFVLRSPCPLSRAHRLRLSPTARSFGSLSSQSPPPHILSAGYSVVLEKTSPHSSKGNDWPCDIKLTQQRKAKGKFILLPCIPQFTWFCHSPDIAKAEPIILLTFHGTSTPNWHSRVIMAEEENKLFSHFSNRSNSRLTQFCHNGTKEKVFLSPYRRRGGRKY